MRSNWFSLLLAICVVLSGDVPRLETAGEQLQHARQLRRVLRQTEGKAQQAARQAAVEAYEAVFAYHPRARAAAVEGFFRAGELQRAAGDSEDALRLFRAAVEVPRPSSGASRSAGSGALRARAMLECGHLLRRRNEFVEALSTYEKVVHGTHVAPKYRDDATFWKARVFLEMGREEDARRVFRGLAEGTEDPLTCVRAYDELALSAVREGDLEWAAGVLEQCRQAIAGPLREETSLGRRVRSMFRRMRCRLRLKEAIAERRRQRER